MNTYRNYTPIEFFEIFKEQHRICSPLDPEAEPETIIYMDMPLGMEAASDLLSWKKLSDYLNYEFRISF